MKKTLLGTVFGSIAVITGFLSFANAPAFACTTPECQGMSSSSSSTMSSTGMSSSMTSSTSMSSTESSISMSSSSSSSMYPVIEDTTSSAPTECGSSSSEEVVVVPKENITISFPDEVPGAGDAVIKRDIKEELYMLDMMVGKKHHVIVPLKVRVIAPDCKPVKIQYTAYLANIRRNPDTGKMEIVKALNIGSNTVDLMGDKTITAVAEYDKIKDLYAGAPPADHLGADTQYAFMVIVKQLALNPENGKWDLFYPASKQYKSVSLTRAVPPPALIADIDYFKPADVE